MNETVQTHEGRTRKRSHTATETGRTNDPARTMANIIEVALVEFSEKGLAGARIDEISEATQTSKRMIYYYFGSKEGLYLAVLEESYRRMRQKESDLNLDDLAPEPALRRLAEYTFDHHRTHESYIRLVMSENINRGQFLAQSRFIQDMNIPAIDAIRKIYERGVAMGVFRPGLDPLDIHASISALCFFNVSNRHTFGLIFKCDPVAPDYADQRRINVVEMVARYLKA